MAAHTDPKWSQLRLVPRLGLVAETQFRSSFSAKGPMMGVEGLIHRPHRLVKISGPEVPTELSCGILKYPSVGCEKLKTCVVCVICSESLSAFVSRKNQM